MSPRLTVIFLWLCLGLLIVSNFTHSRSSEYESLGGMRLEGQGVVSSEPSITSSGMQTFIIQPDGFRSGLRIGLFHHAYVRKGDLVWFGGQVELSENFSKFNYVAYLEMRGVTAELKKTKILVIKSRSSLFNKTITSIKSWAIRKIDSSYDPNKSGLILGMLIGHDETLSKNLQEAYRKVGLTHILIVSGFNLTILAGGISVIAWFVGRKLSDVTSLVLVWLFVVLTGASGAVVRAGIMASLLLLARMVGRLQQSHIVLLWAVVIMTLINPLRLFYDIGFQLSIAATYGVISMTRFRIGKEPGNLLSETLWPTVGAIIMTAPLVAYYFGTASLVAPLANLLVLPFIPIIMLLGGLSLTFLSSIVIPVLDLLLAVQIFIVELLSSFRWSTANWNPSLEIAVCYYLLFVLIETIYFEYKKLHLKKSVNSDKITKIII